MASVLLVLLVACTNLANLVLARNAAREGELAIRQSLGASRWRLIREALVEHLLVSVAGGVAGLGLARLLLVSLGNGLAVNGRATLTVAPRLDLPVLMMCLGATMLALVVAGLVPSLRMLRRNARATFARQGVAGALPRWRGRRLLIASQVAVSMVLLAIAAVFVSEVRASLHLDVGLDVDRLAVAAVDFTEQHIDSTRVDEIVASVTAALGRRPDVAAVAVSSGLPIELRNPGGRVRDPAVSIEAAAPMPAGDGVGIASVEVLASTTEIFDTLGVSVLRGRGFDERDAAGAEPVVIVSQRTATSVFGTSDVVGRTVEFARSRWVGQEPQSPHSRTIVGVAADTDAGTAGSRSRGAIYLPLTQQAEGGLVFSVRAAGDPTELVGVLRAALLAAEPELAIERIGIGRDVILPPNALTQAAAGGATMLGGFALVLALAGLYGVLSHVVARRRREIGVRLALGATRAIILRDVIRDGLGPVVLGVMVGTAISVVARAGMRPLFQRLVPFGDPMVVLVVPALLMAAGLLACYVPARRAARVDPNIALRDV
jgi:putative ABC transport system permease protein